MSPRKVLHPDHHPWPGNIRNWSMYQVAVPFAERRKISIWQSAADFLAQLMLRYRKKPR